MIDELDYEAEDHHDPNIDWEEEGTGITSEMIEYWKKYQEKQSNDPARIFNELANAQKSQKRTYEQQSKKVQRDTEKFQKKSEKRVRRDRSLVKF